MLVDRKTQMKRAFWGAFWFNVLAAIAVGLKMYGTQNAKRMIGGDAEEFILGNPIAVFFLIGSCYYWFRGMVHYANGKGYDGVLGVLLGLPPLGLGLFALWLLPDRHPNETHEPWDITPRVAPSIPATTLPPPLRVANTSGSAWHYAKGGETYGPVPESALLDMAKSGYLKRTDLVWRLGLPSWISAQSQFETVFNGEIQSMGPNFQSSPPVLPTNTTASSAPESCRGGPSTVTPAVPLAHSRVGSVSIALLMLAALAVAASIAWLWQVNHIVPQSMIVHSNTDSPSRPVQDVVQVNDQVTQDRKLRTPAPALTPSGRELAQKSQEMKIIQDQLQDLRDQSLNTLSTQPLISSSNASNDKLDQIEPNIIRLYRANAGLDALNILPNPHMYTGGLGVDFVKSNKSYFEKLMGSARYEDLLGHTGGPGTDTYTKNFISYDECTPHDCVDGSIILIPVDGSAPIVAYNDAPVGGRDYQLVQLWGSAQGYTPPEPFSEWLQKLASPNCPNCPPNDVHIVYHQ